MESAVLYAFFGMQSCFGVIKEIIREKVLGYQCCVNGDSGRL
jgi:hypothetical protein